LTPPYLVPIREAKGADDFGRKAESLRFLMEKGFKVPSGFVVRSQAMEDFHKDEGRTLSALRQELSSKLDERLRYAIRSSSNQEDASKHSFAGQFKTVLDQQGAEKVLDAILEVWGSSASEGRREYAHRMGEGEDGLRMAVIVQEMARQVFSGVAFSANPLTGEEEVVIEAVAGSGEALV
jgi:pyruvate,water dikinase